MKNLMKLFVALALALATAATAAAQTVTVNNPYSGNGITARIQKQGNMWYPFFYKNSNYDGTISIEYELFSSSGEVIHRHGLESVSEAIPSARGTVGDENPVWIKIQRITPYGGSSSSSSSSSGRSSSGGGSYGGFSGFFGREYALDILAGTGVDYGGLGLKINYVGGSSIGFTAGVGFNPGVLGFGFHRHRLHVRFILTAETRWIAKLLPCTFQNPTNILL